MRPLRDSPVLLPGLPLPDSRRTAHDFDVLLLSTSLTCSEHEPLWRMLKLRLAADAVETPVSLPANVGMVTKWPTLLSKRSRAVAVPDVRSLRLSARDQSQDWHGAGCGVAVGVRWSCWA